jgi:hypothetical protein
MKRPLLYVLFSVILITPITVVLVLAVINQPENSFDSYSAVFDYSSIETSPVEVSDISESIMLTGRFDSSEITEMRVKYGMDNIFIPIVEIGDYVDSNIVIGTLDGKAIYAKKSGVIISARETENGMIFLMKVPDVNLLTIDAPIDSFPYIKASYATFNYLGKEYTCKYKQSTSVARAGESTFSVEYAAIDKGFVLGSVVEVRLYTGNSKKEALVVSDKCIFQDDRGGYYIEKIENNAKIPINISTGITGEDVIEILPADEIASEQLYPGIEAAINNISVVAEDNDNSLDMSNN